MKTTEEKVKQNGKATAKEGTTTRKRTAAKKPTKELTFEEKKEKFNAMFELTKKHTKLKLTLDKLDELLTPNDPVDSGLTLYIREGSTSSNYVADSDFRTSNNMIISHALHFLKGKVMEYLKSLEDDIIQTTV